MLEITARLGEHAMSIYPTAIRDGESWTLIDTGMPGMAEAIRQQVAEAGFPASPLRAIVLTHQDIDHVGGLPGFLAETAGGSSLEVYAHEDDRDAIDGRAPMIKFPPERAAGLLSALPDAIRVPFENTFLHPGKPNVTRLLRDGETLPIGGGLTVVHTPGHTPGHVCLYHHASKTLIAADAMVVHNGKLHGPSPANTPDMEQAIRSLGKLKAFEIDNVICYHGGLYRGDIRQRLAVLTDRP